MIRRHTFCLLAVFMLGCGASQDIAPIVEQSVTVMTFDGEQQVVPLYELFDPSSGEPAFKSVLAIDRRDNRQSFVALDELGGESQANTRYLPVTSSSASETKSNLDSE